MYLLTVVVLLMSFGQYICLPRSCTREERCLPVDASVCDNSKCLLLNQSDVDLTVSRQMKPYTWNIGRTSFFGHCPVTINFDFATPAYGNSTVKSTHTLYSGISCDKSTTVVDTYTTDPDPKTGQMKLLTSEHDGEQYEECFLYLDPGKAFVNRRCLITSSLSSGKACAAILAKTTITEKYTSDELANFVKDMQAELPQITVDCV